MQVKESTKEFILNSAELQIKSVKCGGQGGCGEWEWLYVCFVEWNFLEGQEKLLF